MDALLTKMGGRPRQKASATSSGVGVLPDDALKVVIDHLALWDRATAAVTSKRVKNVCRRACPQEALVVCLPYGSVHTMCGGTWRACAASPFQRPGSDNDSESWREDNIFPSVWTPCQGLLFHLAFDDYGQTRIDVFDVVRNEWRGTDYGSQIGTWRHPKCVFDGKIAFVGGSCANGAYSGLSPIFDVDLMDEHGAWTSLPPLLVATTGSQCCSVDGRYLYVFGGRAAGARGLTTIASVQVYDRVSGAWTMSTPMPSDHCLDTCVLLEERRKVVVWGEDVLRARTVFSFDLDTETWTLARVFKAGASSREAECQQVFRSAGALYVVDERGRPRLASIGDEGGRETVRLSPPFPAPMTHAFWDVPGVEDVDGGYCGSPADFVTRAAAVAV